MSIKPEISPEISVAPMMDWTNRHCRYFHRLISPHALLYTEMVTTGALLHGDAPRFLRFDAAEHPVAFQLGGSDPKDLALCAKMVASEGFDEINLNCGCPSDRVQNGRFGACLMKEPAHVADCIAAMAEVVDIPVTVKCRIGIDEQDDFAFLDEFVDTIADKGCATFIVHARKAWLKGLSPKQNRDIPPLDYDRVRAIKAKYPHLRIILNGGLTDVDSVDKNIQGLDGAMIGREAYSNPFFLGALEARIFGNNDIISREGAALAMMEYARAQKEAFDTPIKSITRHILGMYAHQKGAKAWKRALSTLPYEDGADERVIEHALEAVAKATDWQ
jgi:tRNA-dihydrouridine synthase A